MRFLRRASDGSTRTVTADMHPIDHVAGWVFRFTRSTRVFSDGWGDEADFDYFDTPGTQPGPPPPIEVSWGRSRIEEWGLVATAGRFDGFADLPDASRKARVLKLEPRQGTDRRCVLLPAWNDHGYATRHRLARRLAAAGIGSVLLEGAFYGERRHSDGVAIRTVADFARLSRSIVEEGRGLVATVADGGAEVGVTGYSMGGSLAALVGGSLQPPVAIAPLAASYSPAPVFLDGVLRHAVDWDALGGGTQARERLRSILARASALSLPPTASTATAVLVAARSDGYVPAEATRLLHEHWAGSELRLVPAGHATLLYQRPDALVGAVVDAFERTWGSRSEGEG